MTVGLELAAQGSGGPLGALEGRLRWDPDELAYVGEVPDLPTLSAVNRSRAEEGEMRFAMVNAGGIPALAAVWVFEVLTAAGVGPQGAARVDLELSRGYGLDYAERAVTVVRSGRAKASLPSPDGARHLDLDAWAEMLGSARQAIPRVPGAAEVYGDATQDGLVQAVDALWTLSATVGNIECILGSDDPGHDCLAANVHPFNEPGLGEPSDPCPPGLDSCTSWTRTMQSVDALAILDEAVGNDPPIAGESIPSLVTGDTVTLSGVITGTRTLNADSVYRLQGAVAVGEESGGWVGAGGTLEIPAGTRIIAGSGASLSITAAGTITSSGTELDPIVFECAEAMPEPGCWDGIVLAGTAPVNDGTPAEEADSVAGWTKMSGDLRTWMGHHFGGSSTSHDGGTLEHVVISHAGGSGAALTLGGVGDGTTVRFIQTHASSGAGLQLIGGTVRASHLLSTANQGDYLRVTNGHQGSLQFVTVQMEPDTTDLVGIRVANGPDDLTVIGGTAFTEQHTALAFEDAGATVRNALLVKTGVGLTADAGACDRLAADSLDVDHTGFLGSLEPLAGSCTGDLETALATGSVEGQDGSLLYQAHLTNPFDGELLDDRGGGDTISAATPSAPLDPTGDYLGSSQPGGDQIPWYTGWMRTWERASGFASLPDVDIWNPPPNDTFNVLGPDSVPYARRQLSLGLNPEATEQELEDLFTSFGLRVVGTGTGAYYVNVPDPGPEYADVQTVADSLSGHPAVLFAGVLGGVPVISGLYPIDSIGAGGSRAAWRPDSITGVENWKSIRAPQAWFCEHGMHSSPEVTAGTLEFDYWTGHDDLSGHSVVDAVPRTPTGPPYRLHGVAVAGQVAAEGDNGVGIAGMNWGADLRMIAVPDLSGRTLVRSLAQGVRQARTSGVQVLSISVSAWSLGSVDPLVTQLETLLDQDGRALLIIAGGQVGTMTQPIPTPAASTPVVTVRAAAELVDPGYGSRVIMVSGSQSRVYQDSTFLYTGQNAPAQLSAPYEHQVLDTTSQGTVAAEGTSFGAPMVAGLATLLYQMKPELTAEQVFDLIMDGAREPDVVGGGANLVDQIIGLPAGFTQPLYELDAFSSMQLLSRTHADSPVCGLDVYQLDSNEDRRIGRDTPQDHPVHGIAPISVAPGGRHIAVGNRIYSHEGSLVDSVPGFAWIEFIESLEDTAFYTWSGDTATVQLERSGSGQAFPGLDSFLGTLPIEVSPGGSQVLYTTADSVGTCGGSYPIVRSSIWIAPLGGGSPTELAPVEACTATEVDTWTSARWSEYGDEVIVGRYLDSDQNDQNDPWTLQYWRLPVGGGEQYPSSPRLLRGACRAQDPGRADSGHHLLQGRRVRLPVRLLAAILATGASRRIA